VTRTKKEHPADQADQAEPTGPALISQGTYAVYKTTKGGLHLSYLPDGMTEEGHYQISGKLIRFAERMAKQAGEGGKPDGLAGKLMSMMGLEP
jgi:hypothetical protein